MRRFLFVLPLILTAACAEPEDEPLSPALTLPALYDYDIAGPCGERCWSLTLYRSGTEIALRAHDQPGHVFLGITTGQLSAETSAELTAMIDALRSGEQSLGELPGGVPIDGTINTLWLPDLTLRYMTNHPPSGVIELDKLLTSILDDLSQCRTNVRVDPDSGCEPLAHFPE
jgi:hypothetical protein